MTGQAGAVTAVSSRSFSPLAGATAVLAGFLVLIGWMFDIAVFKSVLPDLVSMKANAALGFVVAGVSLWLQCPPAASPARRRTARVFASVTALLGLLTLGEYVPGRDFGIDQLLFQDTSAQSIYPGRMASSTASIFVLLGGALFFLDWETRRGYRPAQFLVLPAAVLSLLGLIGYTYGAETLYRVAPYSSMALHTALAFLVLGLGILYARPDRGLMHVLTSHTAGGVMARRLLPAAVLVPVIMGWLRLEGERTGLYGFEFGLALFALSNIIIFTVLAGWIARLFVPRGRRARAGDEAPGGARPGPGVLERRAGTLRLRGLARLAGAAAHGVELHPAARQALPRQARSRGRRVHRLCRGRGRAHAAADRRPAGVLPRRHARPGVRADRRR
jgi:methyl-accepting chemotaxis protein